MNKYGVIYDNAKDEYEAMIEEKKFPKADFPSNNDDDENLSSTAPRKSSDPK